MATDTFFVVNLSSSQGNIIFHIKAVVKWFFSTNLNISKILVDLSISSDSFHDLSWFILKDLLFKAFWPPHLTCARISGLKTFSQLSIIPVSPFSFFSHNGGLNFTSHNQQISISISDHVIFIFVFVFLFIFVFVFSLIFWSCL